jgi:Ras-related protein Rab-1A
MLIVAVLPCGSFSQADLVDLKQVPEETAQKFAEKLGISFLETSAKTATNVDAAFLTMSKELIAAREKAAAGASNGSKSGNKVQLKSTAAKKDTKCCK